MTIWCYILLILASLEIVTPRGEDYFQENFDENKNCKQEKLIKQLLKDEDDIRCSQDSRRVSCKGIDEEQHWQVLENLERSVNYSDEDVVFLHAICCKILKKNKEAARLYLKLDR